MKRLQKDRPHPGWNPNHRLVLRDRSVRRDGGDRFQVGDGPAAEQEVARLFIYGYGRAIVGVALRVLADEL
jgi:hypothetical protein